MGLGGSTLLPAPDERLLKSIKMLDLSNTDLAKVNFITLNTPVLIVPYVNIAAQLCPLRYPDYASRCIDPLRTASAARSSIKDATTRSAAAPLKPAPCLLSVRACMHITKQKHTTLRQGFKLFCSHDKAQRGCLTLGNVYKMLGERKSIFGDSLFELIGERYGRQTLLLLPQ